MKRLLTILIGLILAVSLVSAASRNPQPRPFSLYFRYNNENVVGLDVTFKIGDQSITKTTNRFGGAGVDLDLGYSPDFSIGKDLSDWDLYSQVLTVSCALDLCSKEYAFKDFSTPYEETFVLMEAPPVTCSPCNCGGGGSSCSYTEDKCNNLYPPEECESTCPPEKICDTCEVVEDCEICEISKPCEVCEGPIIPETNSLYAILSLIFGALVGGGGIYFFKKREATVKNVGIKTYVSTDGKVKVLHRHPGIKGYHNPETLHRVEYEKHPRGEIAPLYEKDETGTYNYVG